MTTSIVPRRRWRIAFLLAFGVLVNFFDRINLSVSRDALHDSFGLSLVAFGYLSSAFSWTYALMQMPAGVWLDRWGVRRVGRVSALLWSVSSFAAAVAPGLSWFFGARFLLGVSESPTFPANAKALGYWFTRDERGMATAITDAAAKFSSAIGVPFIGLVLLYFGWRWSFAATGFISLLYFVVFYFVYRNPSEDEKLSEQELQFLLSGGTQPEDQVRARSGSSLGYLLTQRKVYGLALGWGAYNYTFFLLLTWLPSYLSVSLHLDLFHSIFYTSVPWLFATATDLLVGGWLVDTLIQRGYDAHRVRQSVLVTGMSFGLAVFGAARAHGPAAALVWISLALGGLAAAAPVAWTIPSLIAPRESVGTLAGMVNLCGQIAAICAPIVTGYIVSASHSFAAAFVTATLILLMGIAGYIFLLGRIEAIPEP
ncbi:MAG TPA: MFS transporter [Candidatus Polarisedimenticolia bacterium]|nr:MFS transporter [Candidatus Polarisedimenticolia bacterium]